MSDFTETVSPSSTTVTATATKNVSKRKRKPNPYYRAKYNAMSGKQLQARIKHLTARKGMEDVGEIDTASLNRRIKLARIAQERNTFQSEYGNDWRKQVFGGKFVGQRNKAFKTLRQTGAGNEGQKVAAQKVANRSQDRWEKAIGRVSRRRRGRRAGRAQMSARAGRVSGGLNG